MSIRRFLTTIQLILGKTQEGKARGITRHILWQTRKIFNAFPFELRISNSKIIAEHRYCGVSVLVNSMGMYDYNNMSLLKHLLSTGGVFFDIGANIGSYTLVASEQRASKVYSFEPHPLTFKRLSGNIILNNRDNVKMYNIALGNEDGEIGFSNLKAWGVNKISPLSEDGVIKVPCKRIDTFCKEKNAVPSIVKIDVEGFEYDVLIGFGEVISKVDLFFIEDWKTKGLSEIFSKNQFNGPYHIDFNKKLFKINMQTDEDVIFVSSEYKNKLKSDGFMFEN